MKTIIIKEISFLNFKGFREQHFEFNEELTKICGRNGLGKTTIFDGFTWLLFGKDSQDRKTFELKTLDENGVAIPKIPHEVSAILKVDGEYITLCRRFTEKWTKKRGTTEAEFTGHEEERLYNDVPLSLKEWNEKISAICSEQIFKYITNPKYFVSQKPDVQRAMLFRMAGEVSDAEIAIGNEDFTALLASLTGKTMEEYKKEIQAKKRRIKGEIEAIPSRIDERKRDNSEMEALNFNALEQSLKEKQAQLSEIEECLLDASKKSKAVADNRAALIKKQAEIGTKITSLRFQLKEDALRASNERNAERTKKQGELTNAQNELRNADCSLKMAEVNLSSIAKEREALIAEWKQINKETITFKEDDFTCPTCGRPFEVDDIETKQKAMTENFNANKVARLKKNEAKGQQLKKNREEQEAIKEKYTTITNDLSEKISKLHEEIMATPLDIPETPADTEEIIALDTEYKAIGTQLEEIVYPTTNTEDKERKQVLISEIDEVKKSLTKKEAIQRNNERIAELEEQYKNGAQELADLERTEFTISEFSKARIEAIDSRINGMFKFVKFRMFAQQINGGEVETCEATVDGVPYSNLNSAMQINAGLDIIGAIVRFEKITAPVFIDNAESVNEIERIPNTQQIALKVTEDDTLLIL